MSWAIITGASSGIGLEMAKILATQEPNLRMLLVARREDRLKSLQQELAGRGVEAEVMVLDLTEPRAGKLIEDRIRSSGYGVRWLINSAGFGYGGPFDKQPIENIERMVALNITALTMLTRRILSLMESEGRIVNVASSAGFVPLAGMSVYAASKSYVLSLSRALDAELRHTREVTVTAVCPGPVATEFFSVAGMEGQNPVPGALYERPADTARRALRAARRGETVVTTGLAASGLRLMTSLTPQKFFVRAMMRPLGDKTSQ